MQEFPDQIDWDAIRQFILSNLFHIVLILVGSIVLYYVLKWSTSRLSRRIQTFDDLDNSEFDNRTRTIFRFVHSVGAVVIIATATLMIMNELGVNTAPLLASVGIVGLALGLGAQTLVKDAISGLFILIENQFTVGDAIRVDAVSGTVEMLTLRTTHVRDLYGTLHIIPNGEIRVLSNMSNQWSRAVVELVIPHEYEPGNMLALLEEVAAETQQTEGFDQLTDGPISVSGVEALDERGATFRIVVKTNPGQQWNVQRVLRQQILQRFRADGIRLATQQQTIRIAPATTEINPAETQRNSGASSKT
jgi:small conductance mechanosensitive channel